MLITKYIKIRIVPANINYLSKIYNNIKINDYIEIDINNLSQNSPIKIECICEVCEKINKLEYRKYLKNKNKYGFYSCKKCKNKKTKMTCELLYNNSVYNNSQKMIKTKEERFIYIPQNLLSEFKKYRKYVNRITYKNKKILYNEWSGYDYYDNEYIKENIKYNSNDMNYPTVDHKISIFEGFNKKINPEIIGSIDNLCITKRKINLIKNKKENFVYKSQQ